MTPPAPIVFAPLTRTDFVRYAGASGDFNPLHHDARFAEAAGLSDVMGHGMLSAGLLASAVSAWFGAGSIQKFSVRFQKPVWPGDRLTASCDIEAVRSEGGEMVVDLTLKLAREPYDIVISGTALVFTTRSLLDDMPKSLGKQGK